VGMQHLADNPSFQSLMEEQGRGERGEPKVVICGGKGGVGKSKYNPAINARRLLRMKHLVLTGFGRFL